MKSKFYLLLSALFINCYQIFAGAGIWHSSINLIINGDAGNYAITPNESVSDAALPKSIKLTDKFISVDGFSVDVWKDQQGNICTGNYLVSILDVTKKVLINKEFVITYSSESNNVFNGKNQIWTNSTFEKIDLSKLEQGTYTLSISGWVMGSQNSSTDCSEKINDKSISCSIIIERGSNPDPNPDPDVDPEPNPDPEPEIPYTSSVPSECTDVMLQSFYWDSNDTVKAKYGLTRWTSLTSQASELGAYFDLIWLSPSSKSGGGLGYHPQCWSDQNSALGNERQLRNLIDRLHSNGARVIADIVVNHRESKTGWIDFYKDEFGEFGRYQFTGAHICKDDEVNFDPESTDKGKATGADDTGEKYAAARDLDHTNNYVRNAVKAYLKWLQKEFHYDGFRYDVAKGFSPQYFGEYSRDSKVPFSVGEFLDGDINSLKWWIDGTGKNSLAFDFATKFNGFNEMAKGNYNALKGAGLLGAGYSKYAVTMIDNHDNFERGNGNDFAPITDKDKILQANAYLLSMPGVPCVFYPHWVKYKEEIKPMIEARKACGIHSESRVHDENVSNDKYEATIDGKTGTLIVKVGTGASVNITPSGFTKAVSGENYAVFIKTSTVLAPRLIVSPEEGIYEGGTEVTLKSTNSKAKIYYTLDGSDPTSSSNLYSKPISIKKDSTTLKAIAEFNGVRSKQQTHLYLTKKPVRTEGIKVSFYKPDDWKSVFLWAWDDSDKNLYGEKWPGKAINDDGDGWWSYTFPKDELYVNIIFNNGDSDEKKNIQTGDMTGVNVSTCYLFVEHKAKPLISPDCSIVGVENVIDNSNIVLYPNPAKNNLYFESDKIINSVYVYSATGMRVKSIDLNTYDVMINVSDLYNGLYFIRCQMEDGNVVTSKFIKQ